MKNISIHIFALIFTLVFIWSCEDEVDIDLGETDEIFTVDAWLTNVADTQRIFLSRSTDYFNNESLAPAVTGAEVFVEDALGVRFDFVEQENGTYEWISPVAGQGFGEIGLQYSLTINVDGASYSSSTILKPTSVVDSVYFVEDEDPIEGEFIRADFQARDLPTIGDTYWVKAYKNDILLNKVEEINIAYEAGITAGGGEDQNGKNFIPPIRFSINDFDEFPLYDDGDRVRVEIYSISLEAFNFLSLLRFQGGREAGLGAIFDSPLNNVSTNIESSRADEVVIGIFNVAAMESNERVLIPEEVVPMN